MEINTNSLFPASFVMSEIIRKGQEFDDNFMIIGLEKKSGKPLDYTEEIGLAFVNEIHAAQVPTSSAINAAAIPNNNATTASLYHHRYYPHHYYHRCRRRH